MVASLPSVSVVIPTRNRRTLLARALATALGQRSVDVEVFVVDEGSEDSTAEFVCGLADPRVTLIRHDVPKGVSAARNAGLDRARAPWVAFLDDDDLWAPNKLLLQLEAAAETGAGWVCVGDVIIDEGLTIVSGKTPPSGDRLAELLAYNVVPGGGSGPIVRTELARSVGGFDVELSILADWDMWIRLWIEGAAAAVYKPLVAYLRHAGSMSRLTAGFGRELEFMVAKHAAARRTWGVELSHVRWMQWTAQMYVRSGDRRRAVGAYVHLARRYRDYRSLVRAVLGGLSPAVLVGLWRRRSRQRIPAVLYREAEAWLAPLRSGLGAGSRLQAIQADHPAGHDLERSVETFRRCSSSAD